MLTRKKRLPDLPLTEAQQVLVVKNQRLIGFVIEHSGWNFLRYGDRKELEDEMQLGLIRAAQLYDSALGKFSTYAVSWLKSRLQLWVEEEMRKQRVGRFLLSELGNGDPDSCEIDNEDFSSPEISRVVHLREMMERCRKCLPRKWWRVLCLLYLEGRTYPAAGEQLGLSRERIRQIRDASLLVLRRRLKVEAESV